MGDAADQLDEQMQRLYLRNAAKCRYCHKILDDDELDEHVCKASLAYKLDQLTKRVAKLEAQLGGK